MSASSHMSISLTTKDGEFNCQVGAKLMTFAIDEHRNKSVMFATADLPRVAALLVSTLKEWERAQEVEKAANTPS